MKNVRSQSLVSYHSQISSINDDMGALMANSALLYIFEQNVNVKERMKMIKMYVFLFKKSFDKGLPFQLSAQRK